MSAAQRDLLPLDEPAAETEATAPVALKEPFALKEQVAQRLAAHRARRTQRSGSAQTPIASPEPANSRTSRIAAAVAERYANSQSYRAFLAAQAETAIREAQAAAEVAALNAQAVADAQFQLLAELDQWTLTPSAPPPATPSEHAPRITEALPSTPSNPSQAYGLTVRLYDEEQVPQKYLQPHLTSNRVDSLLSLDETEALALDEEIAFRQSPVFEDAAPPVDLPANLIEFPRQLVAPRKARPRLAEGPLREEADHSAHQNPETAQLRIFEVEAAQISTAPAVESVDPEWSSILLAAHPHPTTPLLETPEAPFQPVFSSPTKSQTAPFNLRLMAAVVDGCLIAAALLAFIAVAALAVGKFSEGHATIATEIHMTPQAALLAATATLIVLTLLYQLLFFTFSEATPGMRYARIGLCTFSDDNPTRAAIRRRIVATILAACPLGIGFLWAWLDDDGLGWHDRISRMYQRSY
ncbi:MAG: RDD family protein [Edaphobacter sp.]